MKPATQSHYRDLVLRAVAHILPLAGADGDASEASERRGRAGA